MRLPVFAHIQLDDILLAAEQRFAQCVAQLGLAHSTGPQEQKTPDGAPGIPQPSIAAQDGMDNRLHRLLLPHHTLPQAVFQPLGRKSLSHRKSGHRPRRLLYLPLGQHQPPGCSHSALQHACPVDPQPGRRLIQQVQRLIRQKACREIPHRKPDRRLQCILGNDHPVVLFIARAQPPQDRHCLFLGRLLHQNTLEPPGQRAVLFDGLAVLRYGGGTNNLQFPAGKFRLHDISRIYRAFRRANAHNGMNLINKKNHIPSRRHFLHNGPDPLLKVTAILSTGHHCWQVQSNDPLIRQSQRHPALRNALRQPLHHGGLAHSRLTDQTGIIFGTPGKDLQ